MIFGFFKKLIKLFKSAYLLSDFIYVIIQQFKYIFYMIRLANLVLFVKLVRLKARNVSQFVLQFIIYPKITQLYQYVRKINGAL